MADSAEHGGSFIAVTNIDVPDNERPRDAPEGESDDLVQLRQARQSTPVSL